MAVHHANDLNPVRQRGVEYDIAPNWEAAQIGRQIGPRSARERIFNQHLEDRADTIDLPVCRINAVGRNKAPDRIEIDDNLIALPEPICHACAPPVVPVRVF